MKGRETKENSETAKKGKAEKTGKAAEISKAAENDKIYLSTGIDNLNKLLSPDSIIEDPDKAGGFLLHVKCNNCLLETPVILIEGTTGAGKTLLAMQIAFSVIEQESNGIPWRVYFYSLEQSKYALENIAMNFGWTDEGSAGGFKDLADPGTDPEGEPGHINLCHFSPHPPEENEDGFVFEQRKEELLHAIKHVCDGRYGPDGSESYHPLFVLDSLTAFADRNLTRNQLYQLFELFRAKNVPVIMTVEKYSYYTSEQDTITLESAKYLADIVIELSVDNLDYFKYQLEIIKSKVCRQGLGTHLYKIRTKTYACTSGSKAETGIVLYPSIHFELSNIRKNEQDGDLNRKENDLFKICCDAGDDEVLKSDDLYRIFNQKTIGKGSCISVLGPAGSHKLALAANIAVAHHRNTTQEEERNRKPGKKKNAARGEGKAKVLIISFGNTSDFNFKKIAWTKENETYGNLIKGKGDDSDKVKYWHDEYCFIDGDDKETPVIDVTTFRMGQLSSEECFHVVEKKIMGGANEESSPYSAIILANTAEICTSFPQLARDPLFLPSLIELFMTKNIVSVCICVKTDLSSSIEEANLAVLSKANYRIYLSHYPTIEELSENLVLEGGEDSGIKEQLISLIVDNVSGKNYSRVPIWLSIEEGVGETNKLRCTKGPIFKEDKEQASAGKAGSDI